MMKEKPAPTIVGTEKEGKGKHQEQRHTLSPPVFLIALYGTQSQEPQQQGEQDVVACQMKAVVQQRPWYFGDERTDQQAVTIATSIAGVKKSFDQQKGKEGEGQATYASHDDIPVDSLVVIEKQGLCEFSMISQKE